jgi:phosphonate transport system permease protein
VRAPIRLADGSYREPRWRVLSAASLWRAALLAAGAILFASCLVLAEVSPARLWNGLPIMARWVATAWPPFLKEVDLMLWRAAETVAIATVGTAFATVFAFPLSVLVAGNTTPAPALAFPVRWLANTCRAIDTVVFAILFVAAVGLGPFAGVLGMIVHSVGVIGKLNSEAIETIPAAPLEAVAMTGANRAKIVTYAVLPSALPSLASVSLYVWEANVRTSTVLGIVGAGGIGLEIKAAMDLLDFPRLLTLSVIVLVMVTVIDQLSARLRRRLV